MTPAPSQFSRLLQQSRIASFDPAVPQVYTAPKAYIARGEWGMKRPMPSTTASPAAPHLGMLRYVEMNQLDTMDRQADWKEREKETLFVKRWAEANTKLNIQQPDNGSKSSAEPGSHGPRPTTSFLESSERYLPSDIPGPIEPAAEEDPTAKEARLYNNQWREMMKFHAERGAADPSYKSLGFKGAKSRSPIFGLDSDKYTTHPRMTTNYNALSDKQFDKYVERIRADRRLWLQHYEAKERKRLVAEARTRQEEEYAAAVAARKDAKRRDAPLPPLPEFDPTIEPEVEVSQIDMLEKSRHVTATRDAFALLDEQALRKAASPDSKRMPGTSQSSTMHPHAGLQYAQPDSIFTNVLSEPVPGRVIHEISSRSERDVRRHAKMSDGRSVLVGGRVGYLHAPLRSQSPPTIDWSRQNVKQGTALFRIIDAYRTTNLALGLGMHKDMLTPRNDLGYIRSHVEHVKTDTNGQLLVPDHPPGSPAYIGNATKDPDRPVRRALSMFDSRSPAFSQDDNHRPLANVYSFGQRRRNEASHPRRLGRNQSNPSAQRAQNDTPQDSAQSTKQMFENLEHLVKPRD